MSGSVMLTLSFLKEVFSSTSMGWRSFIMRVFSPTLIVTGSPPVKGETTRESLLIEVTLPTTFSPGRFIPPRSRGREGWGCAGSACAGWSCENACTNPSASIGTSSKILFIALFLRKIAFHQTEVGYSKDEHRVKR